MDFALEVEIALHQMIAAHDELEIGLAVAVDVALDHAALRDAERACPLRFLMMLMVALEGLAQITVDQVERLVARFDRIRIDSPEVDVVGMAEILNDVAPA